MTMDIANLSETMRQGEATRAALGVQMRTRPLWSGAGRLSGVPARYVSPYRLRGVNSPELLYENIVHNGAVYVAPDPNAALVTNGAGANSRHTTMAVARPPKIAFRRRSTFRA